MLIHVLTIDFATRVAVVLVFLLWILYALARFRLTHDYLHVSMIPALGMITIYYTIITVYAAAGWDDSPLRLGFRTVFLFFGLCGLLTAWAKFGAAKKEYHARIDLASYFAYLESDAGRATLEQELSERERAKSPTRPVDPHLRRETASTTTRG